MDLSSAIERDRENVLAIPGVVDLAYGEDDAGSHALVFVEDENAVERVEREVDRRSLLAGCRVVVQPQLSIGLE